MASNPMQRKARNSFLLGMVIALVIAAIPVVFLVMKSKDLQNTINQSKALLTSVYVLNKDVKSGQTITPDMFSLVQATKAGVPSNATSDVQTMLSTYALSDKAGNQIYTDEQGLYMLENGKSVRLNKEENSDNYYKIDSNNNNNKVYIELSEKPLIAKVDLKQNTIITSKYLERSNEMTTDDTRLQAYNTIVLPESLETGDFVDIRLMLPDGRDYIVLSKKEADIPCYNGTYSTDTVNFTMREDEILVLSSAIVDAAKIEGSKLYAIKYVEPGNQASAKPTYVANNEVINLIKKDSNVLKEAMTELAQRYNGDTRNDIQSKVKGDDTAVVTKVEESVTKTKEERQKYLDSLSGGTSSTEY